MIVKTSIASTLFQRALVTTLAVSLLLTVAAPPPAHAAEETTFTFDGGGWGHGIGLSQYGAKGYAAEGWTHDRILKHYFQGTDIVSKPTATVRVNLDKAKAARSTWQIQAGSDTTLTITQASDTTVKIALREMVSGAPAKYWITTLNANTRLHNDAAGQPGTIIKSFSGRCYVSAATAIRIVSKSGPFDHAGVRWRGRLHFSPSTSTTSLCINYVDLEDYLKGVVPRESPSSWPAEALMAQAVAARSYAYDDAVNNRVLWCTTMSQVYNGHSRPGYAHEPASTTAAVTDTQGKLVWYGNESKPVKTYFSSSTGGHTANIEDVWFSAAKPYYKGVVDADSAGNPYYAWTTGALSASSISTKVRAKVGSLYSAPSPHVISGIRLELAATGHARYAHITWSNGATHRIKGDTLRGALGLKSTRFTVKTTHPGPATTLNSEKNTNLAWSGIWSNISRSSAYGGTDRATKLPRSQLIARFEGTGVKWVGTKTPALGRASVEIDGVRVATVDLYSSKTSARRTLFSKTGLSAGEHTLRITALNSKNSRSSGYGATVDRINVVGGRLFKASPPLQRYQNHGARAATLGGWSTESDPSASMGTHITNERPGAKVIVDFVGTSVKWIGATGPDRGTAKISIDGGTPVSVTLDSASVEHQRTLYSRTGLSAAKTHRLIIQVVGPTGSSSGLTSVDRIDVTGGWVIAPRLPLKRVQQTGLTTKGSWKTYRHRLASGGTHIASGTKGASVTIPFEGHAIAWHGAKTKWYGKAEVLLDGKRVAVVDLYSPTTKLNQRIWSVGGLPAKRHTLTVRALGTRRASALGTLVSVDAFGVNGQLAPR
jgi:stage II sporulation protein D